MLTITPKDKRISHNKHIINTGQVFGCLKVVCEIDPFISRGGVSSRVFRFECKCGKIIDRALSPIREGRVVSCGCHNSEKRTKHGCSSTDLYKVLTGMRQRCSNPKNRKFSIYGGRGIKVCDEWMNEAESFIEWALKNGYKKGLTIDRIDGDKNYDPSNCRIVDYGVQNNNTARNHFLNIFGESKTVVEWSRDARCSVGYETFAARIKRGWESTIALTKPKHTKL